MCDCEKIQGLISVKKIQHLLSFFKKSAFEKNLVLLIGYSTNNLLLFQTALNHRSVKEHSSENNERLEFLGDAIISSVVADYLFKKYPYKGEGFLTEMRSKMVNRQQLNHIAIQMGLKRLTKFNKLDGGLKTSQIFGNTLEALVGAIYIDKKYEFTKKWIVNKMIQPYLFMDELELIDINIKNKIFFFLFFSLSLLKFDLCHSHSSPRIPYNSIQFYFIINKYI
jgi:ribonuclease-3